MKAFLLVFGHHRFYATLAIREGPISTNSRPDLSPSPPGRGASRSLWLPGTLALLLLGSTTMSSAGTFIAFGPVQYSRDSGKPTPVTKTFNIFDLSPAFTMRIDSAGVSSAIVTLNGVDIFKESDFNQTVKVLTKAVTPLATNQLTVELRGKSGETFALQIIGLSGLTPEQTLSTLADEVLSGNYDAALKRFSPSPLNCDTLLALDSSARAKLAAAFRNATFVKQVGELRVYGVLWTENNGHSRQIRISLFQTSNGDWIVSTW